MDTLLKLMMAFSVIIGMGMLSSGAYATGAAGGNGTWGAIGGGTDRASRGQGELFLAMEDTTENLAADMKNVIFGGSAIGALALGVLAFFGRFQWVWFFGLIGGLVLIAGINLGVEYLTGDDDAIGESQNKARN